MIRREPDHDALRRRRPLLFGLDPDTARVAWTLLAIAAMLALVYLIRRVLLVIAFSVFFAYLIFPLVRAGQRFIPGLASRARAIVLVYLVLIGAVAGLGAAVGPRVSSDVRGLADKVPDISRESTSAIVGRTLERFGWREEIVDRIEGAVESHAGEILASTQGAATAVLKWLAGAWVVVLVPIFAFFILKDAEEFVATVTGLFEQGRHRRRSLEIMRDLHHLLGEYMRALVLLSIITFAVWSIVFLIAGLPYPFMLATAGGVLEALPLVGPFVAGVIVVTVAVFTGYGHALLLIGFIVAWRLVQDYVTNPLVMGRGIELHPALVIFGVIAGGEIAGPVGMFLSIPVLAGLRVFWRHAREARRARGDADSAHS